MFGGATVKGEKESKQFQRKNHVITRLDAIDHENKPLSGKKKTKSKLLVEKRDLAQIL
jgi:hypothetical protein